MNEALVYKVCYCITTLQGIAQGLFVLYKNPKSRVNVTWALMSFAVAVWAIIGYTSFFEPDYDKALLFARISNYGALWIPVFFAHFCLALCEKSLKSDRVCCSAWVYQFFCVNSFSELLIWNSPRFSEDLDFTGLKISLSQMESLMEDVLIKIEREGIYTEIGESKTTSGGYLAIFRFEAGGYATRIQIEVSLRPGRSAKTKSAVSLVQTELVPSYTLVHLDEGLLVGEKIQACLSRGKARDFYDLYFILRSRMALQESFVKDRTLKRKILGAIEQEKLNFRKELKQFLPVNQHSIIKGFPAALVSEIERYLPGK